MMYRYIDVVDENGVETTIDKMAKDIISVAVYLNDTTTFDTKFVCMVTRLIKGIKRVEDYGIKRQYNKKDNTINEKTTWFDNRFDIDNDSDLTEIYTTIANSSKLKELFSEVYRGLGDYNEINEQ